MKKVICTVINDLTYDQRMQRICNSLAKAGYAVVLVGRRLPGSKKLAQLEFEQKRLKCLFNRGKLFYFEYNIRLTIFLLKNKFDGVCSVDLDTLPAGFFASRMKMKTCIYDAHEYFQEVPEVVDRPATKWVWETVASFIIPKLKHCYTVSPGLAAIFTEKYNTPFNTILNVPKSIDSIESRFDDLTSVENKIILYQGALNEGRGLESALKAMTSLEGVEFWLAGEGDLSEELRRLSISLGISNKVKFLGFVLPGDLKRLTPKAFLGFNLLDNKGLSYYYSLANKFFDYIHAGVPTLNPNFPEYKAINTQHEVSYLIESITPEAVKEAIHDAITNTKQYYMLKENCKQAAEVFNWEKEEVKLLNIYEKALP